MSLAKATLRHSLRRKWKLTLGVLLCGIGLVVFTHAYDVAGIIEEGDAAMDALREDPQSFTSEQSDAYARSAMVSGVSGMLAFLFFLGAALVGFLMPGGVVANERRSATIMLWAQHPMPLSHFYLQRYLWMQVANLAAQALFAVVAILAVFPPAALPPTELGVFVEVCLVGAMACAISFAVSALGLRRAAFLGLAYYFLSTIVGSVAGEAAGGAWGQVSPTLAVIFDVLPFVIFPANPIDDLVAGFASGTAWDWGATGLVLYHLALWTAVAWLGLRRIEGKPLKL